jgi:ATP-dependent exoDNAse (exonuclease V) alpha subunit
MQEFCDGVSLRHLCAIHNVQELQCPGQVCRQNGASAFSSPIARRDNAVLQSLRFQSNTRTKLHDYVVVEEYSMCSKSDATELKSRAKGSIIIPVGDPNQLPPVGATEPGFPNTDNLPQELSLQKRQAVQSPILLASMELVRKQMCFTPSGRTGDWLPGEKVLRSHGITVRTASAQNNWADVSSITTRLFLTHETMASPLTDIGIICGLHETRRGLNDSIAEGLRFQRQAAFSTENEIWNAQYGAEFFIPVPSFPPPTRSACRVCP